MEVFALSLAKSNQSGIFYVDDCGWGVEFEVWPTGLSELCEWEPTLLFL
jgi:hypothetical protein